MSEEKALHESPGLRSLYLKAVAGALPFLGASGETLPDTTLTLDGIVIDKAHLVAYDRVCGFRVQDVLPATYPHVLAFPLQMSIMTERDFPFAVIGLVHVGNTIEVRRPVTLSDELSLRVWAEDLRPHPKGRQLDLVSEATVDGEVVWTDRSTYLRQGKGDPDAKSKRPDPPKAEGLALWSVPGDIGRRYADVSGDSNPIHLHGLTARAFGQKSAIAHGMWMKARCLAALEQTLPDAYRVDVAFTSTLGIPGKATFATDTTKRHRRFALLPPKDGGRPYVVGQVTAR
jgi:acyl dehydratase